jgi:hypothetical protein
VEDEDLEKGGMVRNEGHQDVIHETTAWSERRLRDVTSVPQPFHVTMGGLPPALSSGELNQLFFID